MRRLLAVAANLFFIFGFLMTSYAQETTPLEVPATSVVPIETTPDAVIAAYQAGNYRAIETTGTQFDVSSNGAYVSAFDAGVYRISDGMVMGQFDNAVFSPNGAYFAEDGDGIYRLPDLQRIIAIEPVVIPFSEGESSDDDNEPRELITGNVTFSSDSQYAAITGAGVYRLSDAQKVIDTSNYPLLHSGVFDITFSPDSTMVATGFGVFRLSDTYQIGTSLGRRPSFSEDNGYVWLDYVYRLSDGVRLFEVHSPHGVDFSPNVQYAAVLQDGMYQLSDGQRIYALPEYEPDFSHAVFSADSQYMITPDGVYIVATGEKIFAAPDGAFGMEALFSPDGTHIAIANDGVYRLSDRVKLFDISGSVSSGVFSPDGQSLALSNNGLYRLSDGQRLFTIQGSVRSFTDDGAYIRVGYGTPEDGFAVYRVLDGQRFSGLQILDVSRGILAEGSRVLVVQPTQA
jgi:WD40 repeat protein